MGLSVHCVQLLPCQKSFLPSSLPEQEFAKLSSWTLHLHHAFWLHIHQLQHSVVILYPADPGETKRAWYLHRQAVTLKGDWKNLGNDGCETSLTSWLLLSSNLLLPWPSVKHFFLSLFLLTKQKSQTVPWPPLFVSFSFFTHFDYLLCIPQVSTLENSHQVWICMPDKWERTDWRGKPQPSFICYLIHLSV